MSDPYRIGQPPNDGGYARWQDAGPAGGGGSQQGGITSTLLWIITAICACLNTALSIAGQEVVGGLFGGLAVAGLVALLVRYLNRRKR